MKKGGPEDPGNEDRYVESEENVDVYREAQHDKPLLGKGLTYLSGQRR
jgi:hypothetical protein